MWPAVSVRPLWSKEISTWRQPKSPNALKHQHAQTVMNTRAPFLASFKHTVSFVAMPMSLHTMFRESNHKTAVAAVAGAVHSHRCGVDYNVVILFGFVQCIVKWCFSIKCSTISPIICIFSMLLDVQWKWICADLASVKASDRAEPPRPSLKIFFIFNFMSSTKRDCSAPFSSVSKPAKHATWFTTVFTEFMCCASGQMWSK